MNIHLQVIVEGIFSGVQERLSIKISDAKEAMCTSCNHSKITYVLYENKNSIFFLTHTSVHKIPNSSSYIAFYSMTFIYLYHTYMNVSFDSFI